MHNEDAKAFSLRSTTASRNTPALPMVIGGWRALWYELSEFANRFVCVMLSSLCLVTF